MAVPWSKLPFQFTRLGFILFCVVLFCLASAGASENLDVFSSGSSPAGGRNLLQITNPCPHQFSLDNFTNLQLACPPVNSSDTTNYPKTACCAALAVMLCPWQSYINDPKSDCAANFWDTLPLATNNTLTQSVFMVICTDTNSPKGIPCPSTPAPAPNHSSPRLAWELLPVAVIMMAVHFWFSML